MVIENKILYRMLVTQDRVPLHNAMGISVFESGQKGLFVGIVESKTSVDEVLNDNSGLAFAT